MHCVFLYKQLPHRVYSRSEVVHTEHRQQKWILWKLYTFLCGYVIKYPGNFGIISFHDHINKKVVSKQLLKYIILYAYKSTWWMVTVNWQRTSTFFLFQVILWDAMRTVCWQLKCWLKVTLDACGLLILTEVIFLVSGLMIIIAKLNIAS